MKYISCKIYIYFLRSPILRDISDIPVDLLDDLLCQTRSDQCHRCIRLDLFTYKEHRKDNKPPGFGISLSGMDPLDLKVDTSSPYG